MMALIPTPDTIPTPWGYFQFLLLLTFPLHLFFMNGLIGATAIAIYSQRQSDELSHALAGELSRRIPLLVALTVNLGIAPIIFLQVLYGHLFYTSSILMGIFWIAIVPVLILCYYAAYWYHFKFATFGQAGPVILAVAGLGFYGIAFLLSNNMTLMLHPESWTAYFEQSHGTLLNLGDITLWPRYLHFMIGGTAVGGLLVALYGRVLARRNAELGACATARGMRVFLSLTVIQIIIGIWFLLALPRAQMFLFMGRNLLATVTFVVALLLVVAVLVAAFKKHLYLTAAAVVPLVWMMVFMRDFLRRSYLEGIFTPAQLQVVAQYSPLVFFVATLVVGLALISWMLRAAATRCGDTGRP